MGNQDGWKRKIKYIIIQTIILLVIFVITLFVSNRIQSIDDTARYHEMYQSSLPLVYMGMEGEKINCMYGFTSEVNQTLFRDSLTPIKEESNEIELYIEPYKNEIKTVSYQVRLVDGSSLIEEGQVPVEDKKAVINLRMDLNANQEYILVLTLVTDRKVRINYYTRIIKSNEINLKDELEFAGYLHESLLNKVKSVEVEEYFEEEKTGNQSNMAKVDIHSGFDLISWGGLEPVVVTPVVPTVKEYANQETLIEMKYFISADVGDLTRYYTVTECFTVSVKEGEKSLSAYSRNMEEVFQVSLVDTKNNRFRFGISSMEESDWMVSENNKKAIFVKAGELWYYDYQNTKISKVFGFRQEDFSDARNNNDQYNINILKMQSDGVIYFTVYGYMNRGEHEGECGIALYRYFPEENCIGELAFIPSTKPYQVLKEDIKQLSYMKGDHLFYFYISGEICVVDTKNLTTDVIDTNILEETLCVSKDGSLVAYMKEDSIYKEIIKLDLNQGTVEAIKAPDSSRIKPVGFMEEDLVYGIADEGDVVEEDQKVVKFPMKALEIIGKNNEVVKVYKKDGLYLMDAYINDAILTIERAEKFGEEYTPVADDYIANKEDSEEDVVLKKISNSERYLESFLVFPNYVYVTTVPKYVMTRQRVREDVAIVSVPESGGNSKKYYVYAQGTLKSSYTDAAQALTEAFRLDGVVVNHAQKYIWEKNKSEYAKIEEVEFVKADSKEETLAACLATILNYEGVETNKEDLKNLAQSPENILRDQLECDGIYFKGISLDQVLYYIDKGSMVIAKKSPDEYVLIFSYNATYIRYIDLQTMEEMKVERKLIEPELKQAGNIYITYIN